MGQPQNDRRSLGDLATIWPGYPFRGKLPLDDKGDAYVVQFRHVVVGEPLNDQGGKTLDRVRLTGRKRPNYLRPGDVIFMAKGAHNKAVLIGDVPDNTVCAPNFYHIRLSPEVHALMPAFLAWQLNHADAQRCFANCAQGSVAPSITKLHLASLIVAIPPIEKQKLLVKLAGAAVREQRLLNQLIDNRQRMVDALGRQLLRPAQAIRN